MLQLSEGEGRCSPARMVNLARRYEVPEWLPPAFRQLINTDAASITAEDLLYLSDGEAFATTYLLISQARSEIIKLRRSCLIIVSPSSHGPACYSRSGCTEAWSTHYRVYMAMYNHPTEILSATEVIDRMERAEAPQPMGPCWQRSIDVLKAGRFTTGEMELIDRFVNRLVAL